MPQSTPIREKSLWTVPGRCRRHMPPRSFFQPVRDPLQHTSVLRKTLSCFTASVHTLPPCVIRRASRGRRVSGKREKEARQLLQHSRNQDVEDGGRKNRKLSGVPRETNPGAKSFFKTLPRLMQSPLRLSKTDGNPTKSAAPVAEIFPKSMKKRRPCSVLGVPLTRAFHRRDMTAFMKQLRFCTVNQPATMRDSRRQPELLPRSL